MAKKNGKYSAHCKSCGELIRNHNKIEEKLCLVCKFAKEKK